jgi:hypothetical protein
LNYVKQAHKGSYSYYYDGVQEQGEVLAFLVRALVEVPVLALAEFPVLVPGMAL